MKQLLLISLLGSIALTGGLYVHNRFASENQAYNNLLDFSLPDLSGKQREFSEWQGKVVIVNFWATWCPSCRKEIPEFVGLQQEFGKNGLQFVGIALEEKEPVAEFLKFIEPNYPMLIAGLEGEFLSAKYGNVMGALPFTVVINPQGQIIHRQVGGFSREQILAVISPLLNRQS